jgi:hypothetical protein
LLEWGPPVRDVSSASGPPVGHHCPPGGHAASAVPFTTGVRPGPVEAAPLSELTIAPVRSAWPRATSAPPLPVLAHIAVPSVRPREPELESTPSRARAPFYSLVARAADRRGPTPLAAPSPSRVHRPKPPILELQRRSAKPHTSRLDAGPTALHRLRVRCRPPSPIAPLFHDASQCRAEPLHASLSIGQDRVRLSIAPRCHLCASCQRPVVHLEPPVSPSPSLPAIELLPLHHPPRRRAIPRHPRPTPRRAVVWNAASRTLSFPPRECLHADGPPPAESAPLYPPQAPGQPRAAPGLAAHCS